MAKRVQVTLVDDTDGTPAEECVTFALDGVTYEIDLSKKNAEDLRAGLSKWVESARRVSGRRSASRPAATPSRDLNAIREWGRAHGYKVSDRGRVSRELEAAYNEAKAS